MPLFEPSIQSISAGTTKATSREVVFADSHGVSFGANLNTITASVNEVALGVSTIGNTAGDTGTTQGTVVFVGAGNVTLSQITAVGSQATIIINATMPVTAVSGVFIAAGTQTATSGTVLLSDANGISFAMAGSSAITASFDAIKSISAGTTVVTSPQVVFSDANGISFGANGATITASISVAATAQPIIVFSQPDFATNFTVWPGLASFQKVSMPMAISGSSGLVLLELLGHSNSSGAVTIAIAAYQLTQSTATNITSRSGTFSWTSGSDTSFASVYGGASGTRYRSFVWDVSMTPGDYLFAFAISTANDGTCRIYGRQGANIVGSFAGAETNYFLDGHTNSTIAAFPVDVVANNTNYVRTGLSAQKQPGFILIGTN